MAFQVIPAISKFGLQLLKRTPQIAAGAGITTGAAVGISNVAVNTPGLNEALGQTPEQQAKERSGNFNRRTGEEDRGVITKFVDTVTGRDLTKVNPGDEAGRSYLQQASDARILTDNAVQDAKLKNARNQLPGLSGVELLPNMTAEEYRTAVAQELENAKQALSIQARGGTIPALITAATLAGAEQTTPDSVMGQRRYATEQENKRNTRADIIRGEERLDQSNRELRQERRYLREMAAQREQQANQFALQMAQQQYQNRALDMRDAADQRKDKMMIIAQIMKGLEGSARAFTY